MKNLLFLIILALPTLSHAEELTINYGVNMVDINADGIDDIILKTRWDNGNARSFDKYLISIQVEASQKKFYEVPLGDSAQYSFTTKEGAGCAVESSDGLSHLVDYKFSKHGDGLLAVKRFERDHGKGYADKQPVIITSYKLIDEVKAYGSTTVGIPRFYLKELSQKESENMYCNVHELIDLNKK